MSFRELRNFTETMKALGYPRLISVDNFRIPNFVLVADILFWLVHRYDPTCELSGDISTEDSRIELLKTVAQIMAIKARIKLNIKQLYRADGYAVKELLKISSLLYDAMQVQSLEEVKSDNTEINIPSKLEELKEARNLANDIVEAGSKLYTLLGNEDKIKDSRDRALKFVDDISLNLDSNDPHEQIERTIRQQIINLQDNVNDLEKRCVDLETDQKALKQKIERKHADLERVEKRFKSLKKVRPAFMDEYDQMEKELKTVYDTYLERFRNLQFLESELTKYNMAEMEKKNESDRILKKMQKRLRDDELAILRGDRDVDENQIDDTVYDSGKESDGESEKKSKIKKGRKPSGPGNGNTHFNKSKNRMQESKQQGEGDSDSAESEAGDDDLAASNAEENEQQGGNDQDEGNDGDGGEGGEEEAGGEDDPRRSSGQNPGHQDKKGKKKGEDEEEVSDDFDEKAEGEGDAESGGDEDDYF